MKEAGPSTQTYWISSSRSETCICVFKRLHRWFWFVNDWLTLSCTHWSYHIGCYMSCLGKHRLILTVIKNHDQLERALLSILRLFSIFKLGLSAVLSIQGTASLIQSSITLLPLSKVVFPPCTSSPLSPFTVPTGQLSMFSTGSCLNTLNWAGLAFLLSQQLVQHLVRASSVVQAVSRHDHLHNELRLKYHGVNILDPCPMREWIHKRTMASLYIKTEFCRQCASTSPRNQPTIYSI